MNQQNKALVKWLVDHGAEFTYNGRTKEVRITAIYNSATLRHLVESNKVWFADGVLQVTMEDELD